MTINEYFSKKQIISNLSKYEMFYQVSLGNLINKFQTNEISYDIELQYALGSIYEMLKEIENQKDENLIFEMELKKQASMDALQYFVNENLELIKNGQIEVEDMVNNINDNIFFNEAMNKICEDNIPLQIEKWSNIINEDLASAIISSLEELEKQ